jgi:hypothetical protein
LEQQAPHSPFGANRCRGHREENDSEGQGKILNSKPRAAIEMPTREMERTFNGSAMQKFELVKRADSAYVAASTFGRTMWPFRLR